MKKHYLRAIFATLLILAGAGTAPAGDEQDRFTLGYGSLTPSRTDTKAEQFGQLTARYRIGSTISFKPYVGTGLGYSYQPVLNPGDTPKIRAGVAGQAGFSCLLGERSSLNLDYKVLELSPDRLPGSGSSTPQSVGVGLEIKF